jgi:hypothetical protein
MEQAFVYSTDVDTSLAPGLAWPVVIPSLPPSTFQADIQQVNVSVSETTDTVSFVGYWELRRRDSSGYFSFASTDTAVEVFHDLQYDWFLSEADTTVVGGSRVIEDWSVSLTALVSDIDSATATANLGIRALHRLGDSCPGNCDEYRLQIQVELTKQRGLWVPQPSAQSWLSGVIRERASSGAVESGVLVEWSLVGHVISGGQLETTTRSGEFARTDTLFLCP